MKIVFLDHHTLNSDGLDITLLEDLGEVDYYKRSNPESVLQRCHEASVIITNKVVIDRKIIESCAQLQLICVAATGYNNVDIVAARERKIDVCNVRNYSTESVVQHTFALIFRILNNVSYYHERVLAGDWQENQDFSFYHHSIRELSGKVLGVLGYGHIGKRVADVATMMGMKVLAYRRNRGLEIHPPHHLVDLEELFAKSDILTCHAPLNSASKHIINKSNLSKMKSQAILINTARGGLVNEQHLAEALKTGVISWAGLDTLSQEPPAKDNPLLSCPNCIITPHMAWASVESRKALVQGLYNNIKGFQKGSPINIVNPL
jgi:glycerate dehydrogenase